MVETDKKQPYSKVTHAKLLILEYIDEHEYLYDTVKNILKDQLRVQFDNMHSLIGFTELACRRSVAISKEKDFDPKLVK